MWIVDLDVVWPAAAPRPRPRPGPAPGRFWLASTCDHMFFLRMMASERRKKQLKLAKIQKPFKIVNSPRDH